MKGLTSDLVQKLEERGYTPLSELGRGGMGVVLLAEQKSLARQVAVKLLLPEHVDASVVRRFQNEGRIFKELAHPNLVRLYDVSLEPPYPFLVFEYVPGSTTLVESISAKLDRSAAWSLLRAILSALAYLHERNVVHRDVKPGNVLVDAQGNPRIIDLGLARQLDANITRQTRDGAVLATPAYAPPEQLFGEDVGPTADVYSWGLMAIELLAGRAMFAGQGPNAIPASIRLASGVPQVSTLVPGLNALQSRLLIRCTLADPQQRPANATTALAELDRSLSAPALSPVTAVIPPPAKTPRVPADVRPARSGRNRRALVISTVVMAVVLAVASRSSRPRPVASESPSHPSDSRPLEIGLTSSSAGATLEGTCPGDTLIELRWTARGQPQTASHPAAGAFRIPVEAAALATIEVRAGGRSILAPELLRPHVSRLVQMLDEVDFGAMHRRAEALVARSAVKPEAVPEGFLPLGLARELGRTGALVEPALDGGAAADLQRRLLTRLWQLEVLDAHLASRGRTPRLAASEVLKSWSERIWRPFVPENPRVRVQRFQNGVTHNIRTMANGQPALSAWWVEGPDWQLVNWAAPEGSDAPEMSFQWDQPQMPKNASSYEMAIDSILDSSCVLELELNADIKVPLCAWVPPSKIPELKVLTRVRRLPRWALKHGPSRLVVRVRPYDGSSHTNKPYVGSMSFLASSEAPERAPH